MAVYGIIGGALWCVVFFLPCDQARRMISPERPVVPNVTATSPTEIKMNWCRVKSNNVEIDHYELFIDNELEYSGIDVMYFAKRLKPWTAYEIKLRACGFHPGASCSPFSRPMLVRTLANGDNYTAIHQSTASVLKVLVVPTYMFITGFIVGMVILALALVWRYLQCNDSWTDDPPFELPKYVSHDKRLTTQHEHPQVLPPDYQIYVNEKVPPSQENMLSQTHDQTYCQIANTDKGCGYSGLTEQVLRQSISVQATMDDSLSSSIIPGGAQEDLPFCVSVTKVDKEGQQFVLSICDAQSTKTITREDEYCECPQGRERSVSNIEVKILGSNNGSTATGPIIQAGNDGNCGRATLIYKQQGQQMDNVVRESHDSVDSSKDTELVSETEHCFNDHFIHEYVPTEKTPCDESKGIVCVVDNSNIYIGAQECASATNPGDRKRNVRVKLQNLVRILEKGRPKERLFVCGSSPPATEHVWDVYRHLGYIVDLEERRGKDEQRVDEGLHLCIYKAICELSPRVLVLATGDGMKGKSENATSFPGCASMALERGWHVELYSWKHSLSTEWTKLARKYPHQLNIHFLNSYVNHITFVDGKNGRKCLPFPPELDRGPSCGQRMGRAIQHNG